MIYGYARTSTTDQENSIRTQVDALKAAGCEMVREERRSGASQEGREELKLLLEFIRPGDTLIVTKLDRLARSIRDVMDIHAKLIAKGASLRILNMNLDTSTSTGKLMLGVLGSVAEFERDLIRERQREGIARAKADGRYIGGVRKHDPERIRELKAAGLGTGKIAAELGCSDDTVRRALKSPISIGVTP